MLVSASRGLEGGRLCAARPHTGTVLTPAPLWWLVVAHAIGDAQFWMSRVRLCLVGPRGPVWLEEAVGLACSGEVLAPALRFFSSGSME